MKSILLSILAMLILCNCEKETNMESEIEPQIVVNDDCEAGTLFTCIPPLMVDTSCVRMQMKENDIDYKPLANWACIIPNIILGEDQLWVNGSLPIGIKVLSIIMPKDIEPGTYPMLQGTRYTAIYVPSQNSPNYITISGSLVIAEHDQDERYILGGFDCLTQNIDNPNFQSNFTMGCFEAYY